MANYVFPTSQQLMAIAQDKLPTLTQDDPIFSLFPIQAKNMINIKWEQKDTYKGLQQLRGVGGAPSRVTRPGAKSYMYAPGVYGEYIDIGEKEILERRPLGTWDGFVDLTDLVMDAQDQLLNRRVDRIRWICWTLVTTGAFYVALPNGATGHGDAYANISALGQFGMQTFAAGTAWSNAASSTPLLDFRNVQLLARGRSVDFGPTAVAYMNRSTFINMIKNTNAADLGGKKSVTSLFSTLTSAGDVNKFLMDADLPQIQIYDGGYIDENNVFQLFIPTGTVMVIGGRTNGETLGAYWMTRDTNNADTGGGPWQKVIDRGAGPYPSIPRTIDIYDGHSGGPVLFYPSAIVRMSV